MCGGTHPGASNSMRPHPFSSVAAQVHFSCPSRDVNSGGATVVVMGLSVILMVSAVAYMENHPGLKG